MEISVSPTHGAQEDSIWNGPFGCTCYPPNFIFNQFGMLDARTLRPENVHSCEGWKALLEPVIARYAKWPIMPFFRADAACANAYANPELYETVEGAGNFYAIRLRANNVLRQQIDHVLRRPVGRPSQSKIKRFFAGCECWASLWQKARRVIAKVEWHSRDLIPGVGFVVAKMAMDADWVVCFSNFRGTADLAIKEGKHAINWTRLSCKRPVDNEVRL
jgi:hypothetical protein